MIEAKGRPISSNIGLAFGILLFIVAILAVSNIVVTIIFAFISLMILVASSRHTEHARQKKLREFRRI
jgi:hypothetical protein